MRRLLSHFSLQLLFLLPASAQTITIDTSHPTNRFVPNQTLGAGVDRIPAAAIDADLVQPNLARTLESGWQPVTYRQNTELAVEAWHWNPKGTWSDPAGKGYFVGSTTPRNSSATPIGYALPHRGVTRNDGTGNVGFSRITDGDESTYWKSNPYLTSRFTGEERRAPSAMGHPRSRADEMVERIRIAWADPYATDYVRPILDRR